jgi:hypothetical protein
VGKQRARQVGVGVAIAAVIAFGVGVLSCNLVLGVADFDYFDRDCETGALRCSDDDRPQRCDMNGRWQNDAPPCGACKGGCDRLTGVCSTLFLPNGTSCTRGDLCTVDGICQRGECDPIPEPYAQVECVAGDVCSLVACNSTSGSCAAEGTPCDDGDSCTDFSACNKEGICESESDRGWAHWDLASAPPPERYVTTDDVVFDRMTRLTWQRYVSVESYTWEEAKSYCSGLKIPGYPSGWQLPTRIELVSIVDYSRILPAIDTDAFPNTPSVDYFWSLSTYQNQSDKAWNVATFVGNVYGDDTGKVHRARCVRAPAVPNTRGNDPCYKRYTDTQDTVTDNDTHLTWQKIVSEGDIHTQEEAKAYCENLPLDGGGWRLPNIFELQTIVAENREFPAIYPLTFPVVMSGPFYFWSSTSDAGAMPDNGWKIDFRVGDVNLELNTHKLNARCVR